MLVLEFCPLRLLFARWLLSVARAFQPEFCPSAIDLRTGAGEFAGDLASREAAKPRSREGWWVVGAFFEYEYRPPGRTEYEYEGSFLGFSDSNFA